MVSVVGTFPGTASAPRWPVLEAQSHDPISPVMGQSELPLSRGMCAITCAIPNIPLG